MQALRMRVGFGSASSMMTTTSVLGHGGHARVASAVPIGQRWINYGEVNSDGWSEHQSVVIVGGGTAGLAVANQILELQPGISITVVEPSERHYYQPGWTMAGAGIIKKEATRRTEAEVMPKDVRWLRSAVQKFLPGFNAILTEDGHKLTYNFLVVCPGLQINWNKVKGLEESLGKNGVVSNYSYKYVDKTWDELQKFRSGGKAIFTHPATPIKCGGAPQKIMYLAEDYFKRESKTSSIAFYSGQPSIFTSPPYAQVLTKICKERNISTHFKHDLVEIKGAEKKAVFKQLDTQELLTVDYDFIHVTPPMGPCDFVKNSPIADAAGWVDVDKHTTRHKKYPNIFSLGDASSLPTSKTAAAISAQAYVLSHNLTQATANCPERFIQYDGYTSCPLMTGYDKLVLAEFDYSLGRRETFPFDQRKERKSMYLLKRHVFPALYWNALIKGKWHSAAFDFPAWTRTSVPPPAAAAVTATK
eukprot:TRINITY_DN1287_c0_g2_i1.p1 TRINITY_DN1287_c0_g2~~TRINITY_DN1287_c0_g2_i1.p1  ORF type:complete len:492 (+),score=84.52 TRINITY_DN1287_c0_g2_i1:57-1478(+)